jgi:hypothetical protein
MRLKLRINKILRLSIASLLSASCAGKIDLTVESSTPSSSETTSAADNPTVSRFVYPKFGSLKLSLTDAPKKNLTNVFVNVEQMELFVAKGGIERRLIVGRKIGMVDLLTLRNGVLLPIANLDLPEDIQISQIRLVLRGENNHAIKDDGSRCELKTPSGQQAGVKILLKNPVQISDGYTYSMIVDFDAEKSVVIRGNGTCLLKPVLKLLQVTREKTHVVPDPSSTPAPTDPGPSSPELITDGTDSNIDESSSPGFDFFDERGELIPPEQLGFDIYDPSSYPEGITEDQLSMYF